MRFLPLIFLLSLLSACDSGGRPEQAAGKGAELVERSGSVQPGAQTPQKTAPPPVQLPAVQPAQPSSPTQQPAPEKKTSPLPKGRKSKEMLVGAPNIELDLKLSDDPSFSWEALGAGGLERPKQLLPLFFQESNESTGPFQLSGKLITGKDGDDYWSSVDGAELHFEFKQ